MHPLLAVALAADPTLLPGDRAPAFTAAAWLTGSAADSPRLGRYTLVEFWATWCGPCKAAMPHLAALDRSGEADVVLVDIQEKDPAKATAWLTDSGYADLPCAQGDTGAPALKDAWWKASGQVGIPATFLVGPDGTLLWMGHPSSVDAPLHAARSGTLDAQKARQEYLTHRAQMQVVIEVHRQLRALDDKSARLAVVLAAEADHPEVAKMLADVHFKLLTELDPRQAEAFAAALTPDHSAATFNDVAWRFVDPAARLVPQDPTLPVRLAERAVALEPSAAHLDTLAVARWWAGDRAGAVAAAEQALAVLGNSPDERADYELRLSRMRSGEGP